MIHPVERKDIPRHRTLHGSIVGDTARNEVGWFIYCSDGNGLIDVLQMYALPSYENDVVAAFFREAEKRGAVGATRRTDFTLLGPLAENRALFRAGNPWSVALGDLDVRAAPQGSDAFYSRLQGEWW